ncbi:Glu-tRNA(Gln) amidotransferase subunit GatE [Patescibacteria group bacterium]|nr:Glu-tRNA(Gln) amidotransferase subunit GatE [Patescibacteria group bacterium]
MTEKDYQKLGLKCGLEIHQQLNSSRKLFCNCPTILRKDEPDFVIKRKFTPILGELGELDLASKYEASLAKEFFYQGYLDTNCSIECDEAPPLEIDKEALHVALQIVLLLNCKIVPITQIMRKTVIDGSNTSGFQRTVLIARDGFVDTASGRVKISYVYLEEDSARKVKNPEGVEPEKISDKKITYRLDRLGIPLVEIVTAPDIKTPEQAKEVALFIGDLLRSCNVRRGIGTIRQDINVSITGHPRVEIKGFQDPKIFVKVIENEIDRQQKNLEKIKSSGEVFFPEVRGANPDTTTRYLRPLPGSARMYPETDLPLLKISRNIIDNAKKNLPKIRGELESELKQEGLSKEMILLLLKSRKVEEFRELLAILKKPELIVKMLLIFPKEISTKRKIPFSEIEKKLNIETLSQILENLKKGIIKESEIKGALEKIIQGKNILEITNTEKLNLEDTEELILKIINKKTGLSLNAYMGLVMAELKGKISGKEALEIIKKLIK